MRKSRMALVVSGSAVLIGAGALAAPSPLATPAPEASGPPAEPTPAAPGGQVFAGPAVSNPRGTYQAQIEVVDGVVVDVEALTAGTNASESLRVNETAIPVLRERVLEAQTWEVDAVSGASFTSPAMIESLRGAFEAAGLD